MDVEFLDRMLLELRAAGSDHQTIEAKKARTALPATTFETLSAFANASGGTLLFGVDEGPGTFAVTGVEDPGRLQSELQAVCAEMEPPLRPVVSVLDHPDGTVVVAELPPVPRTQRPCHRSHDGPHASSYIRVGDADQHLTSSEVEELLAARSGHDHSRRPAPDGATLDPTAVEVLLTTVRENPRNTDMPEQTLLRNWGITNDGAVTIAGLLTLGDSPETFSGAASISYQRQPRHTDPPGTRFASSRPGGTIGQLLDDVMTLLGRDLDTVQVERDGKLIDEYDVPQVALREVLSNALVHRSLSAALDTAAIKVEVSDDAVVVTSPGGLHTAADPATLGLAAIAGVRNNCLVRLAEQLRTPQGQRIVEHQASGIAAADRACRTNGTMPAIFIDQPATFQAVLLRRSLDPTPAKTLLAEAGVDASSDNVRIVSVLMRLAAISTELPVPVFGHVAFDARFAARALSPCTPEDAAAALRQLEQANVLVRGRTRTFPTWTLAAPAAPVAPTRVPAASEGETATSKPAVTTAKAKKTRADDRIPEVLAALAAADSRELRAKAIGDALGTTSPDTRTRWIRRALDKGLIEPTKENAFDPNMGYRLTRTGLAQHRAELARASKAAEPPAP